jgi:NitT/TauT family transport system permease protein
VVSLRDRALQLLPPLVFGIAFLLVWEWFVTWRDIQPYLLPKPSLVWEEIRANTDKIWSATRNTGTNALVGLVAGAAVAVAMALVSSRFRVFSGMLAPVAAAVNAMPIIALVPIYNNLFGSTSPIPRRLVVAIVVFFPVFINVFKGLTQTDPTHRELLRALGAGEWDVQRKLRLPNALPFFFTGLRLAASLAVIAAVVAEYFGGLQNGLGTFITSAASASAYGRAWAYVAASGVLGLAFYVAAALLERVAMPWRAKRRVGA